MSVSQVKTTAPEVFKSPSQQAVYHKFAELEIPFERVDTDDAVTMDDCVAVDKVLDVSTVKTLLLCNRQKTRFYLFVTRADKPFSTKDFGRAMEIPRVSFAPAEALLSVMGAPVGGASVLGAVTAGDAVEYVFDREAVRSPFYGCNDGTTTSYLKLATNDLWRYMRSCGVSWRVIDL